MATFYIVLYDDTQATADLLASLRAIWKRLEQCDIVFLSYGHNQADASSPCRLSLLGFDQFVSGPVTYLLSKSAAKRLITNEPTTARASSFLSQTALVSKQQLYPFLVKHVQLKQSN